MKEDGNTYHGDKEEQKLVLKLTEKGLVGRSAFVEIYNKYAPGVYRTGMKHLQSHDLAEDLVQEIFSELWNNRDNFTHVQDLKRYLYVMAKNEAFKQFKKLASAEKIYEEFEERKEIGDSEKEGDSITDEYQHLLKTIDELPPRQKEVFELAKLHGLSHDEIAKILDISPKTVNNHITEALRYVRDHGRLSITSITLLLIFMG